MSNKFTGEDFDRILEEIRNGTSDGQRSSKSSPESEKVLAELADEIARIMEWDRDGSADTEVNSAMPTLTKAEIQLKPLTDDIEGNRRDEWFVCPPDNCDRCQVELLRRRYFVDGRLKGSRGWSNMCAECFFQFGEGIGWGSGQAYFQLELGKWLLVGGFPPE